MIILDTISKQFGSIRALTDVSLRVAEGEVVGFLGPNGAGKTTTMRIIVGYLRASSGAVRIDGKDPITDRLHVLSMIGYLPENNPLYPEMTVEEYLQFVMDVKGGSGKAIHDIIAETGIEGVIGSKIEQLSRGYKQRVGLTAALIGNPKILLLDEPTSGLDPIEQEKICSLIKRLGKKRTILLSTHILSEVENVATRLVIINKGKVVYDKPKPKGSGAVERAFKKSIDV